MVFEYDREKSDSNILKHGIDFEDVQQLWDDPERIEIPAKTVDESRFLIIGKIHDRIWSCVIPYRGEKIRIISARRSRDEEVQLYEST
ncbi:MAG TPA: BrnT family toxin [Spirochaetota bacterium]|nr:BrnT family toxin [Spirochaetota bacterium]